MLALIGLIKMDFVSVTFPVFFITLLSTLLISIVIYNRFYPEYFSRIRIRRNINLYLDSKDYHLIENIDFICDDGKKLQIKQLVVSPYGLFIIETCHYRSTIYGSDHQVKWQSKGLMHSTVFINPAMAHKEDCELLTSYLRLPPTLCDVISVFTGNSNFPSPAPTNSCNINSLITTIIEHRNVRVNPKLLPDIITILKKDQKSSQWMMKNA